MLSGHGTTLDCVAFAYEACARWASTDTFDGEEDVPLDSVPYPLSDAARRQMRADVADFLDYCEGEGIPWADAMTPEQLGHDFWLTRNRHGAGFWDLGLGDLGDRLTEAAHAWGEAYLYIGDEEEIHYG